MKHATRLADAQGLYLWCVFDCSRLCALALGACPPSLCKVWGAETVISKTIILSSSSDNGEVERAAKRFDTPSFFTKSSISAITRIPILSRDYAKLVETQRYQDDCTLQASIFNLTSLWFCHGPRFS